MLNNQFTISNMNLSELDIALSWAKKEGWNPGLHDASCFYAVDNQGFFKGVLNDELIAVGSAVNYDDNFAFCGLYIVKNAFRGKGYGMALTKARLAHTAERITGIDGVLERLKDYQNIGYQLDFISTRHKLSSQQSYVFHQNVRAITEKDHPRIAEFEYEQDYFPAKRLAFLNQWLKQKNAVCFLYESNQDVGGYVVARPCVQGYKIGPLFANDRSIAEALLQAVLNKLANTELFIDMPEINEHAKALIKNYQMEPVFQCGRMYRNGHPKLNVAGMYGITTFELG